ncbi:hypothetical protein DUNSADRAFT_4767 [Dunaliella salina]|uniref:ABC1 atypical kinase-like domain-containing protein n=1 Tax=Dunaliella salina TaxID=3046 RepID=A0ABQ7GRB3_DUNSA|nr:hypothetical protein DUNSADRAFT_4767 [Dunaliella salina]|eukprot:KAF5837147.1 hypothetical protein DUNSADRAFT_4767 [Dunaliella salina]
MSLLQQLGREQLGRSASKVPPGLRSSPTRSLALQTRNASKRKSIIPGATSSRPPTPNMPSIKDIGELKLLDGEDAGGDLLDPKKMRNVKSMSYVSRRRMDDPTFDADAVDEEGIPLVYNEQRIAEYWSKRPGEMIKRWTRFTAVSAPWLTKLANAFLSGRIVERQEELAADAVDNLTQLGPTFIKLGQILSIRPDVLPPQIMRQLGLLQDKIEPFSCEEAKAVVEKDLGKPIDELFSEWGDKPIAAASLAQVYKAKLRGSDVPVAVKVQRPSALSTISKDLYVLRRAVGVCTPAFREQLRSPNHRLYCYFFATLLCCCSSRCPTCRSVRVEARCGCVPAAREPLHSRGPCVRSSWHHLCRRVHTMEWIEGVKLITLPPEEIRQYVKVGQEAFLTQLLEIGYFHGDPHPGNLLKITEGPNAGKLALIDFGLVAEIPDDDREAMVSAIIHLSNKDWDSMINDFIELGFLAPDCNRAQIIPVMDRVLSPYLRGGGAAAYNFSALSQDLLAATLEIPFSVPPYISLIARSVVTLEGIALAGDPNYQMVAQAYPFVVRKVLRNDSSSSMALLQDILFDSEGKVKPTRLGALLNAGLGYVADANQSEGFIDIDAVPDDGASVSEVVAFLLSPEARELRPLLVREISNGIDLFLRDRFRKAYALLPGLLALPRIPLLPSLPTPAVLTNPPVFLPGLGMIAAEEAVEMLAPPLSSAEQVYLVSLVELTANLLGVPVADLDSPSLGSIQSMVRTATNPNEQVQEIGAALNTMAGNRANLEVVQGVVLDIVNTLAKRQEERTGVPADQLFGPGLFIARQAVSRLSALGGRLGSQLPEKSSSSTSDSTSTLGSSRAAEAQSSSNGSSDGSSLNGGNGVPSGHSEAPGSRQGRVPAAV